MLTLYQYQNPRSSGYEDKLPQAIANIIASPTVGVAETITVAGSGYDRQSVAVIFPKGEDPQGFTVIPNIYKTPFKCEFTWTPETAGEYQIIIACGHDEISNAVELKALAPISKDMTVEEMRLQGTVVLSDLKKLKVGNDFDNKSELDLLYYKDIKPENKDDGVYIKSKGWLIFPSLVSSKSARKTISFIWHSGNDFNYPVFGYCSEERFNFKSNDYNKSEFSLRFRNQVGCYYHHGLFASARSSSSFLGYSDFDRDNTYRIDIPIDGEKAYMYKLEDKDTTNWFGGTLKMAISLSTAPDLVGQTLYPFFGNYNGDKSPILGVAVR